MHGFSKICFFFSPNKFVLIFLTWRWWWVHQKSAIKKKGDHASLRNSGDLSSSRANSSRIEKSRHIVYVRALLTRKIMHNKHAQCKTEESPQVWIFFFSESVLPHLIYWCTHLGELDQSHLPEFIIHTAIANLLTQLITVTHFPHIGVCSSYRMKMRSGFTWRKRIVTKFTGFIFWLHKGLKQSSQSGVWFALNGWQGPERTGRKSKPLLFDQIAKRHCKFIIRSIPTPRKYQWVYIGNLAGQHFTLATPGH